MSSQDAFPAFDRHVDRDGYVWWYLDALSDDGVNGLTVIAFIGSVFSPYYARARRRGHADPANHCAVNAVLYGPRGKRWAMSERGGGQLARDARQLQIGPSALRWDGNALTIDVDEITVPFPTRLRGRIVVHPGALTGETFRLDAHGRHRWSPVAPRSRVEIDLERPDQRWTGDAYLDFNEGSEPLERGFRRWDWSRCNVGDGAAVLYDAVRSNGRRSALALRFDRHGEVETFETPPSARLETTRIWRIRRRTRCAPGLARVWETLEDTPFYARSTIDTKVLGEPVRAMHESLYLKRFDTPWVQTLLPFRMPRLAGWPTPTLVPGEARLRLAPDHRSEADG